MLKRLRNIGSTLDQMHLSEGKGRSELVAYLAVQGYRAQDVERCVRDLVSAGFLTGTTAAAIGVHLSLEERTQGMQAKRFEDERQMRNLMKSGSRDGSGCAGLVLCFAAGMLLI